MAPKLKVLDERIPALISQGVINNNRSFFMIVGDRAKAHGQIVNLHTFLTKAISNLPNPTDAQKKNPRPTVLWCYKKDLGFTSNRKKREEKIKREVKHGKRDIGDMDPFELFVSVTDVRYTYYKDTDKILGQTFSMLVLQDFEAITPNLLARTIETVEGGGIVVCLLEGMKSLRSLYSMSMDVHSRYRSSISDAAPVARFNERFLLSLGSNPSCLVVDDEFNVLPISAGKDISVLESDGGSLMSSKSKRKETEQDSELTQLKDSLRSTKGVGDVVAEAKTLDQARAILTFTDAITSKTLSQTVSLTAGRGRGKSAALGLSIALAVLNSYSNIFVTSPSPENLKTLFEFVFKGFDRLGWEEHLDYDIVQSSNPEWKGAVVRVNIFRQHRQTIQYIQPQDFHVLGQAELVVIDEAAAIPLPIVKSLLGPYLVFLSSTINGYEGTGRSLSLKLLQQLRDMSRAGASAAASSAKDGQVAARGLKEVKLSTPIRYGTGDQIEAWLNSLLCLDATLSVPSAKTLQGCPHPSTCELYYVNRDTLFSYHPASEVFLQRMISLYVASHYKNSPNDLQLMSDAPGHHLFVLLPPLKENDNTLPDPLVVVQVALEGNIAKETVIESLSRGKLAAGDLIPWTMSQQYQDDAFAGLSGARIVRIATHPDYAQMGYGSRALQMLNLFYSKKLLSYSEVATEHDVVTFEDAAKVKAVAAGGLQDDNIGVRDAAKMLPLLQSLSERVPENLQYLGTSFGITPSLFKFWKRAGYVPLYIRQTQNDLTGEHTCIMLRGLDNNAEESSRWLAAFSGDFTKRFLSLLSYKFREFTPVTALSVLEAANSVKALNAHQTPLTADEIRGFFSPFDMKRLNSYSNNMLDYHVIVDLLPTLATLYFLNRFPADVKLSGVQSCLLVLLGLQRRTIEDGEKEMQLPVAQSLALFVKMIRRLTKSLIDLQKQALLTNGEAAASTRVPDAAQPGAAVPAAEGIDALKEYAIGGDADAWADAEARGGLAAGTDGAATKSSIVTIANPLSTKRKHQDKPKKDKEKKHKKHKPSAPSS